MDGQDMCAGLNYNMTPEQKIEALRVICKEMEDQIPMLDTMVLNLTRWFLDQMSRKTIVYTPLESPKLEELQAITLQLSLFILTYRTRLNKLHFLAYNEYPMSKSEEACENECSGT